jgi:conjugal transfer/type IV secretion protein DotA/TraY
MGFFKTIKRGLTSPVRLVRDDVVNASHRVRDDVDFAKRAMFQVSLAARQAIDEMHEQARRDPDEDMRFEDAIEKWGVGPYPMDQDRALRVNAVLTVVFLIIGGWSVAYGATLVASCQVVAALACAVAAFAGLVTGTACLWRWQVLSHRKYVSFIAWLKRGGSVLAVLAVVATAWAVFSTGSAGADTAGSIDLPSSVQIAKTTDISASLLRYILGDSIFTAIGGSAGAAMPWTNPVGGLIIQILQVLNLASLTFLSVWIIYMWGIFSVATAHEGKKLGGGIYNSLWVPTRHALSFSLTVPVMQGLSLLQVAIIASVCLSVNFANTIWDAAATHIAQSVLSPNNITSISGNSLAAEARRMLPMMFHSSVIQQLDSNIQTKEAGGGGSDYWTNPPQSGDKNTTVSNYTIVQNSNGKMTLSGRPPKWAASSVMGSVSYSYSTDNSQGAQAQQQAAQARIQAAQVLWQGAWQMAGAYLTDPASGNGDASYLPGSSASSTTQSADTLINNYVQTVAQSLQTVAQSLISNNFQGEINAALDVQSGGNGGTNKGWMGAGLFAFAVTEIQAQIDNALLGVVDIQKVNNNSLKGSAGTSVEALMATGSDALDSPSIGWGTFEARALHNAGVYYSKNIDKRLSYSHVAQADSSSSLGQMVEGALERLVMSDTQINATGTGGSSILAGVLESFAASDPFVVIRAFGDRMIGAAYFLLAGGGGLSLLSAAIGGLIGGAANVLTSVSTALALSLWIVGIILAKVAPITPLLFWMRALVGWLYLLLEALVAAPFWGVIVAAPKGEGFAGEAGRKGFFLLVDVLLRAPLLVLGAVFAYGTCRAVGWLIYTLFNSWFLTARGVMSFGLTGDVVYSIIVISIFFHTTILIYTKVVSYFPEHIAKWISDKAAGGLDADQMHEQPSRTVMAAGMQVTQAGNMAFRQLGQQGSKTELAGGGGAPGSGGPGANLPGHIAARAGGSGGGAAALPAAAKAAGKASKAAQAAGMSGTVASAAAASQDEGQGKQDGKDVSQGAQAGVASQGAANPARGGGSTGSTGQARGQAAGQPRSAPQSGGSAVGTSESPEPVQSA